MIEKYLFVGIFALTLVGIAILSARKAKNYQEYNLAGRRLGFSRLVATLGAAEFNTATLIGGASVAYSYGFVGLWYTSLIFIFVFGIYALTVARPYRRLEINTIAEFFERRFTGKNSELTRGVASFVTLTFTWIAPSTYLAGLAVITSVLLGVSPLTTVVVLTIFVLILALAGGFLTAVSIDVVAYVLILIFVPVMFYIGYSNSGGFGAFSSVYEAEFLSLEPVWDLESFGFAAILTWGLQNILLYVAAPWYGQRIFSAKTEKIAYRAMLANTVLITVLYGTVVLTTMFSRVLLPELDAAEEALPTLVNEFAPPILQGLILVTLLLVGISTMVAIWNSAVSIVINDFVRRYFARNKSDNYYIWASRVVFVILGASTLFFALTFIGSILLALTYVSVFTAMLAFPILAGLYWKRFNTTAALASLVVSCLYVSVALILSFPYHLISPVGFVISVVVGTIVALVHTEERDEEALDEFFALAHGESKVKTDA